MFLRYAVSISGSCYLWVEQVTFCTLTCGCLQQNKRMTKSAGLWWWSCSWRWKLSGPSLDFTFTPPLPQSCLGSFKLVWQWNEDLDVVEREESRLAVEHALVPVLVDLIGQGDDIALAEAQLSLVFRLEVVQCPAARLLRGWGNTSKERKNEDDTLRYSHGWNQSFSVKGGGTAHCKLYFSLVSTTSVCDAIRSTVIKTTTSYDIRFLCKKKKKKDFCVAVLPPSPPFPPWPLGDQQSGAPHTDKLGFFATKQFIHCMKFTRQTAG